MSSNSLTDVRHGVLPLWNQSSIRLSILTVGIGILLKSQCLTIYCVEAVYLKFSVWFAVENKTGVFALRCGPQLRFSLCWL